MYLVLKVKTLCLFSATAHRWAYEAYDPKKDLNNRHTLLAVWSRNCAITRAYNVKYYDNKKRVATGFYYPHYEEVLAAYWRHFLNPATFGLNRYRNDEIPYGDQSGRYILLYSSKKPCSFGFRDTTTIRYCTKSMANLLIGHHRRSIGTGLPDVAWKTVYISELTVARSRTSEMGFANWCSTKDNDEHGNFRTFKGLQFEEDTTGTDRSSDPFLLEHIYTNRGIDRFLQTSMIRLVERSRRADRCHSRARGGAGKKRKHPS